MKQSPSHLRVLHVVEATTAGVGRHVLDLSVDMFQAGLDVTVACPQVRDGAQQDTGFVDRLRGVGVPSAIIPMRRRIHPLADLLACRQLQRFIQQREYDVLHAHSSKAGVLGRLAAWRAKVPVVVYTPHAFAFLGTGGRPRLYLYRATERWLGHHLTDALICVSPSELALARREDIAPSDRLVLIENAIDAHAYAPAGDAGDAKIALGLDPHRPALGFIGRLAAQKGIGHLLRAVRLVVDAWDQAQFVLVGEEELDGSVRHILARDHLENHVLLTGHRTDIARVLEALDIFVLPSLYEGMSYTLMEAMAAGRAVVATDVSGNRDLIEGEQTGLLVPPRDARALADAMIRLLSAPDERERLGRGALDAARSRPTLQQMTRQTVEVYMRILESKRKGR